MRRSAYIKTLAQADALPEEIPEFTRYFKDYFNPRREAIERIKQAAREDKLLFHSECAEILTWKGSNAEDTDNSSTVSETQSEENRRECTGSDH